MTEYRASGFNRFPTVIKNLIIINVLVYVACIVLNMQFKFDLSNYSALHFFTSQYFRPYQLVTHLFTHAYYDPSGGGIIFYHILFNMLGLWMFGSPLENFWGPKRFFIFYFFCGLGAALLYTGVQAIQIWHMQQLVDAYAQHPDSAAFATLLEKLGSNINYGALDNFLKAWKENPQDAGFIQQSIDAAQSFITNVKDTPVVGASGAVYGVLLAFGMMFPNTEIIMLFFPIPIKAKYAVILFGALELFLGVTGFQPGVAHFAHLGGMIFAFILIKYWNKTNRSSFF
jgi:membrane associated rhomboid family serine protease